MHHKPDQRRGVSRTEVIVATVAAAVIGAMAVVLISAWPRHDARVVRDSTYIKQVQQAILAKSNETKGGLLAHLPSDHGALWGMCIQHNLFQPDLLVSPMEVNPRVVPCKAADLSAYDPARGNAGTVTGFAVDLQVKCNTSFAAEPLDGTPRCMQAWGLSMSSTLPVMGTRGVMGGVTQGPAYTASNTLRFLEGDRGWRGNICFADNHMEFVESFMLTPSDNLFRNDTFMAPAGSPLRNSDAFLVIQKAAARPDCFLYDTSPELSWD